MAFYGGTFTPQAYQIISAAQAAMTDGIIVIDPTTGLPKRLPLEQLKLMIPKGDPGAPGTPAYALPLDVQVITASTYTLKAADLNNALAFTSASAITVTAPNNLPVGFRCNLLQVGAGRITVVAASGAEITGSADQGILGINLLRGLTSILLPSTQAPIFNFICWQNTGGSAARYALA